MFLLALMSCTPSPRYMTVHSYETYEPGVNEPPPASDTLQAPPDASVMPKPDSLRPAAAIAAPDTAIPPSSWERVFDAPKNLPDTSTGVVERGIAAWYGPGFDGKKTASGERFNSRKFTAAHKTLPFNTMVKVTNLDNGMSVVVRINDRGPFNKNRIIDLSVAAARSIGLDKTGTAGVTVETIAKQAQ